MSGVCSGPASFKGFQQQDPKILWKAGGKFPSFSLATLFPISAKPWHVGQCLGSPRARACRMLNMGRDLIFDFFLGDFVVFSFGGFWVGICKVFVGFRFRFPGIYSTLATLMLRFAAICDTWVTYIKVGI